MRPTRRHVLAALAAVPVIGALGAGHAAWRWWDRPPSAGLSALSAEEFELVQALSEAWMPRGGEPALSGADAKLGLFFDDLIAAMPQEQARELKLLLHVLDDLPRLSHLAPFRALDLSARIEVLRSWLHGDLWLLRNATLAVLTLLSDGFALHPDVQPFIVPHTRCGYGP